MDSWKAKFKASDAEVARLQNEISEREKEIADLTVELADCRARIAKYEPDSSEAEGDE